MKNTAQNQINFRLQPYELPYSLGTFYTLTIGARSFATAETLAAFIKQYAPTDRERLCILEGITAGQLKFTEVAAVGYQGRIEQHHLLTPKQTEAAIKYAKTQARFIRAVYRFVDAETYRTIYGILPEDSSEIIFRSTVATKIIGKPTKAKDWFPVAEERKAAKAERIRQHAEDVREAEAAREAAAANANVTYIWDHRK